MGCFFRIVIWAVWVQLVISLIFLTLFILPCHLSVVKGQMYVHEASSFVSSTRAQFYMTGIVENSKKPVRLSLNNMLRKTSEFGDREEIISKYVDTGIPLDVYICKSCMTSYDSAFIDYKEDGSFSKYSPEEWLFFEFLLIVLVVLMYFLLTRSKKI